MDLFAKVLSPIKPDDFLRDVMGKTHLLLRGSVDKFRALMSWEVLARIIQEHRLDAPRLRLVREGRTIAVSDYVRSEVARRGERVRRPDPAAIETLMREGAMLHLAAADELHLPLSELAKAAEAFLGSIAFVNLHAGLHLSRGFDVHWDGHEVCVLQIEGRKRWRIFGNTIEAPLAVAPGEKGRPPERIVWEGMLNPGDLLYLPRGCWHAAEATDGPTLHLSLGWENPNGGEFLRWLVARARDLIELRRDGPLSSQMDQCESYLRILAGTLRGGLTEESYRIFLEERRRVASSRRHSISLP